jgi:hypothetical protein
MEKKKLISGEINKDKEREKLDKLLYEENESKEKYRPIVVAENQ